MTKDDVINNWFMYSMFFMMVAMLLCIPMSMNYMYLYKLSNAIVFYFNVSVLVGSFILWLYMGIRDYVDYKRNKIAGR